MSILRCEHVTSILKYPGERHLIQVGESFRIFTVRLDVLMVAGIVDTLVYETLVVEEMSLTRVGTNIL